MQILPVVDLQSAAGSERQRHAEIAQLDRACRNAGVFEVLGHSIPQELFTDLFEVTRGFFALTPEEKSLVAQPEPDQVRGWSGPGHEGITYSLDEESPADLKEKMDMGPPGWLDESGRAYRPEDSGAHHAPNLWPDHPGHMRNAWESYHREMSRISESLMSLCAEAFGLHPEHFAAKFDRAISMLRALHYPSQTEPPLPGQMRAGVHTDYGSFTIVTAEDRPGGLEVLRSGSWQPIPIAPGRLICMVGDLFAEWTADAWPATLHRVVNPPRTQALSSSRLAFAFYAHPNYDVGIEALPSFAGDDVQVGPPLTSGDHLRIKYLRQTTFGRQ